MVRLEEIKLGRGVGGAEAAPRWHIQKTVKPKNLLTMQEFHVWYCELDQYFTLSGLDQASFNIQKSIFLQCVSEEMLSRLDSEMEDCTPVEEMKDLVKEEFERRNPRMVLRHKWMKLTQHRYELFTDFMTQEKAARRAADAESITPVQLVSHVLLSGCQNQELLKKFLEIPEGELNPEKIKETADKFEVLKATTKGLNKTTEDKVGGKSH